MAKTVTFAGEQMGVKVQENLKKSLEKRAQEWDTDIIMVLCHGKYDLVPVEQDFDKLYLLMELLPKDFEGIQKTTVKSFKMNGAEFVLPSIEDKAQKCPQGDTLKFTKASERAEVVADEAGFPMAVIEENCIYILNDAVHSRNSEEMQSALTVLNYILDRAVTGTSMLRHLKAGIEEKSKKVLEGAMKANFAQRLEKETMQLKASHDIISQYEKSVVDGMRKIIATERIVETLKRNLQDIPGTLDKTWVALMRMSKGPQYTDISFTKTGIKAVTGNVFIDFSGKRYAMGRYEVKLRFDGETAITALDTKATGGAGSYDHPHISQGKVCWGNFSGYIPKLIATSDFDVALVQIYTFLCHYDKESPYRQIENWPVAEAVKEKSKESTPTVRVEAGV